MNLLCDITTLARSLPLSNHYTAMLLGYHQNTVSCTYNIIIPSYITIYRGEHTKEFWIPAGISREAFVVPVYLIQYTDIYVDTTSILYIIYGHTSGVELTKNHWLYLLSPKLDQYIIKLTQTKFKKCLIINSKSTNIMWND